MRQFSSDTSKKADIPPTDGTNPDGQAQMGARRPRTTQPGVAELATVLLAGQGRSSLEAGLDEAGMGLCLVSCAGSILAANRTMQRLLGYSQQELQSLPLRRILHPAEANLDSLLFRRLCSGEVDSYHLSSRCLHKDGSLRHLGTVVVRLGDGPRPQLLARFVWETAAHASPLPEMDTPELPRQTGEAEDDALQIRLAEEIVRRVKSERIETAARLAAKALLGTSDLSTLAVEMERAVRAIMPADEVVILTCNCSPGLPTPEMRPLGHSAPAGKLLLTLASQALHTGPTKLLESGQPVVLGAGQIAALVAQHRARGATGLDEPLPQAWMGVPVSDMRGGTMGLVAVASYAPGNSYGPQELAMLTLMSQYLGRAIERSLAETALRRSEARFRCIFEHAAMSIATLDLDGRILDMNRNGLALLGYEAEEMVRIRFTDCIHPDDVEESLAAFAELRSGARESFGLLARYLRKDSSTLWGRQVVSLVRDEAGRPWFAISMLEDITEQRNAEELLVRQAFHDALTGLPNRSLFMDRLEASLRRARREHGHGFAVLFLDLNRFKVVNDSLGHGAGDQLLQEISWRLSSCLRDVDTLARFGGDEFAVLLDGLADAAEVSRVIERIQETFKVPFLISGHELFAGASIGVVMDQGDHPGAEDFIRDADIAMYRAKESGGLGYAFFDQGMHEQVKGILRTETDLRKALDRGEFELYYQPIVDLPRGAMAGVEALIRWNHPQRGMVPPSEFIPLAEENGLIFEIDRWVLAWACSALSLWQERFAAAEGLSVAVNLSANYFLKREAVEDLKAILDLTAVDPRGLHLEITENLILSADEHTKAKLFKIKDMGISLVLDDFGTGYSSLSYLRRFPFDCLKIDRSFVLKMLDDENDLAIVQSILGLGQNLGIGVVAEGVETATHAAQLQYLGCPLAQGYHFARPMPAQGIDDLLTGATRLAATCKGAEPLGKPRESR